MLVPGREGVMATSSTFESAAEVLATFGRAMKAIAAAGGPSCEVVLHNLDGTDVDLGHTIMAIENGHVTGREVGGPSTSIGLEVQKDPHGDHDAYGYRGFTSDGRELRCSSTYYRNASGRIIAALCINVDLSAVQQAKFLLDALLPEQQAESAVQPDEYFGRDLVSVMDTMITEAIREVGRPVAQMSRDEKIAVLQRLDARGATQMRKSVETIAVRLGISRVTAYAYLEEARRSADETA